MSLTIIRNNMRDWTPEEKEIQDLVWKIEALGADPLLTQVVILLGDARIKLGEWAVQETKKEEV